VEAGEVFGLLGPNGAGKTSTVEILEGLRTPDSGVVRVCGLDPAQSGDEFKQNVGAVLQATSLPDKLKVKEAIELFANFYKHRADTDKLLKQFQLEEKSSAYYSHLSGGQKQRLALAMALVNDPQVVFLDEPTAGLAPRFVDAVWDQILKIRSLGVAVVIVEQNTRRTLSHADWAHVLALGRNRLEGTGADLLNDEEVGNLYIGKA